MAFGTGLHPTTRLCLALLETQLTPVRACLTSAPGSGILSIAAVKLGAREVLALDLDTIAVDTATRNVSLNHAADRVRVERARWSVSGPVTY